MRIHEREVMSRLIALHPLLAGASSVDAAADPPDAVIAVAGARLGFELTDIFSVGRTNERGNTFLQFERRWLGLKTVILDKLSNRHANLDQCDIYLRLDCNSNDELDLANLPKESEFELFARQLFAAVMRDQQFNRPSNESTDVGIPDTSEFSVLRRYTKRAEIVWRPWVTLLNVVCAVHLTPVEAGCLSTDTVSLETAILRKTEATPEQLGRIQSATLDEFYLVLGGQQSGRLPHIQAASRAHLERALIFVRHPFERSLFNGIILFDDVNDRVEVFCSKCLGALQKYNRMGVGLLNFYNAKMFVIPHACPWLAPPREA